MRSRPARTTDQLWPSKPQTFSRVAHQIRPSAKLGKRNYGVRVARTRPREIVASSGRGTRPCRGRHSARGRHSGQRKRLRGCCRAAVRGAARGTARTLTPSKVSRRIPCSGVPVPEVWTHTLPSLSRPRARHAPSEGFGRTGANLPTGGSNRINWSPVSSSRVPSLRGNKARTAAGGACRRGGERKALVAIILQQLQTVSRDEPKAAGLVACEAMDQRADAIGGSGVAPGKGGVTKQPIRGRQPEGAAALNCHAVALAGGAFFALNHSRQSRLPLEQRVRGRRPNPCGRDRARHIGFVHRAPPRPSNAGHRNAGASSNYSLRLPRGR